MGRAYMHSLRPSSCGPSCSGYLRAEWGATIPGRRTQFLVCFVIYGYLKVASKWVYKISALPRPAESEQQCGSVVERMFSL